MTYTNETQLPYLPNKQEIPWQFEAAFHKNQLQKIRRSLGKDCLYLSHEKVGDKRFIKAVMLNSLGGKDTVPIEIEPNLSLFREQEYNDIQKILSTRSYERDTETV